MRRAAVIGSVALAVLTITAAMLQQNASFDADLVARARITPDQARIQALGAVPGGQITESEIEEENGRLIYSFELEIEGQDGLTEVEIDAITGELLGSEHENSADDEADDLEDVKGGGRTGN